MKISSSNEIAIFRLFQRHLMRITERIYNTYYKDNNYSFWLLAIQIHDFSKLCMVVGMDTIDLQEKIISALYNPHLNAHSTECHQYVFSMLCNSKQDPEARIRAIEKATNNIS